MPLGSYIHKSIFSICRNPYERLLSAYIDKAIQNKGTYVRMFQMPCRWLDSSEHFTNFTLTFKQFIQCIIYNAKAEHRKASRNSTNPLDLSSREAGIHLDQHWAPQVHLSRPCDTLYTMVGRHEHFVDDLAATIKYLKFNSTVRKMNYSPESMKKPLAEWYSQLEPSMISDLKELYKLDFKIFGYDPQLPL